MSLKYKLLLWFAITLTIVLFLAPLMGWGWSYIGEGDTIFHPEGHFTIQQDTIDPVHSLFLDRDIKVKFIPAHSDSEFGILRWEITSIGDIDGIVLPRCGWKKITIPARLELEIEGNKYYVELKGK